jgi:3-oxoacyl-[acyl-carrier-protein] synthase-3
MFINATGYYVPQERIDNEHFLNLNGLTSEWIEKRTGIKTRSRAAADENINTMGLKAVEDALKKLPYDIKEVDLIVSASYSPYDTVVTPAHLAQNHFGIKNAKALFVSSACSSFMNALEIVEAYFALGKASKALVIGGDKNSAYYNEHDPQSGHLWGDASVAFFISKDRINETDGEITDIYTNGLGDSEKAPEAVHLRPIDGGITMPNGKDVFVNACSHMVDSVTRLLEKRGLEIKDLNYFIGHQANIRIMQNIAKQLDLPDEKILHNIEELGNTGSASSALVFAQNEKKFAKGDLVAMSVFGGGYSTGACLIRF